MDLSALHSALAGELARANAAAHKNENEIEVLRIDPPQRLSKISAPAQKCWFFFNAL
jgi:hypothetical protein